MSISDQNCIQCVCSHRLDAQHFFYKKYAITTLKNHLIMFTFYVLKGYWHLTSSASDVSAFVIPDNFLQYTVMSFSLENAPATFQPLVNTVHSDVPDCLAYPDDVIACSPDWCSHMHTLKEVFERPKKFH